MGTQQTEDRRPARQIVDEARRKYESDQNRNEFYDTLTFGIIDQVVGPGTVCVDVGCHVGAVLEVMLSRSPRLVYAFEPIPDLYKILEETFGSRKDVHLSTVALSDNRGSKQFHWVTSNPAYSGFKERHYDRPDEQISLIDVETAPLDGIVEAGVAIDFIKIDVEGAELEVLSGATEILRRDRPVVVFEHGLGAADYYGTKPQDLYELLCDDLGMKISMLDDYLLGDAPMTLERFNEQYHVKWDYYYVAHP